MRLLLLIGPLMRVCVGNDANAFDGAESTKFPLQIPFISIVTQSRNDQGLERIATDVRIIVRIIEFGGHCQQLLNGLFLLPLFPISRLEPTLSWMIHIRLFVLLQLGKKRCNAINSSCFAVLRRIVRRFDPSQGRSRREKGQQVRREFVSHGEGRSRRSIR